jgi:AhpD family alkylhydroperoxidase
MSVATGCKPCTDFHVKAARKSGASDAEIKQAMSDAFAVRRGATEIMEAYALAHLGERRPGADPDRGGTTTRVKELVCIGAAFGVNCVSTLKTHIEAAESVGISHDEITTIAKLSAFIKGKAASHVEHLAESLDKPEAAYEKAVTACC